MSTLTKESLKLVSSAMVTLIQQKGDMNKMVSVDDVESYLLNQNVASFTPVTLCLRALIQVKAVRYFKMDSGKILFGFTKSALQKMAETTAQQNGLEEYIQ